MKIAKLFALGIIAFAVGIAELAQADDPPPTPEDWERLAAVARFIEKQVMAHDFERVAESRFGLVYRASIPSFFADIDGDGRYEFIWQTVSGFVVRKTHGSKVIDSFLPGNPALGSSRIFAFSDFNGDGYADMVAQDKSGRVIVSLQRGIRFKGLVTLADGRKATPAWHAISIGDYNSDKNPDIYWQNDDGRIGVWLMNGTRLVQSKLLFNGKPAPTPWFAVAVAPIPTGSALRTVPMRTLRIPYADPISGSGIIPATRMISGSVTLVAVTNLTITFSNRITVVPAPIITPTSPTNSPDSSGISGVSIQFQ